MAVACARVTLHLPVEALAEKRSFSVLCWSSSSLSPGGEQAPTQRFRLRFLSLSLSLSPSLSLSRTRGFMLVPQNNRESSQLFAILLSHTVGFII